LIRNLERQLRFSAFRRMTKRRPPARAALVAPPSVGLYIN
jgi:hypothetical protein